MPRLGTVLAPGQSVAPHLHQATHCAIWHAKRRFEDQKSELGFDYFAGCS